MDKKEINYFDTPDDRRKGRHGMANLMKKILDDRHKRRTEELLKQLPKENGNT